MTVEFTVRTQAPTLDHYRRDWVPGPGLGLAGMWIGAVVTDAAGQDYWGLRGADDFVMGMTHVVSPVTGFKKLPPSFDPNPPHLFAEYSGIDWFEPLTYADDGAVVQLSYPSGRIERDGNGFHWYDASGRWELHGQPVSEVFTVEASGAAAASGKAATGWTSGRGITSRTASPSRMTTSSRRRRSTADSLWRWRRRSARTPTGSRSTRRAASSTSSVTRRKSRRVRRSRAAGAG